jgi:hypothetical protein
MPTALRRGPYRFYFFLSDCPEPRHMHVSRDALSCKLWLDADVRIADNQGYSWRELLRIARITRRHLEELRHAWDAFCGGDP